MSRRQDPVMRTGLKRALYAQTLQRAADKLGGLAPLGKKLGVRSESLTLWLKGKGHPPRDIFLRAASLLKDERTSK